MQFKICGADKYIQTNYMVSELTLTDSAPGVMSPNRWLNKSSEWPGLP